MKILFYLIMLWVANPYSGHAQSSKTFEARHVKQLLDSKQYIFKAQAVTPNRGGLLQLTSEYDMRVFKDSLITHLPFFGRAFTASIATTEGGFNFTSTDFTYEVKARKKGWDISILPKDTRDVRQLLLYVTNSGQATLQVVSTNREAISFRGMIVSRGSR